MLTFRSGHTIVLCFTLAIHSILFAAKAPQIMLQPTSKKDISPGKAITFTIEASGTEPLSYQWQRKLAGKGAMRDKWQKLTTDHSTFQEVEAGLKVASVQAYTAGYYRCVVSNTAGSETSQTASLSVGKIT